MKAVNSPHVTVSEIPALWNYLKVFVSCGLTSHKETVREAYIKWTTAPPTGSKLFQGVHGPLSTLHWSMPGPEDIELGLLGLGIALYQAEPEPMEQFLETWVRDRFIEMSPKASALLFYLSVGLEERAGASRIGRFEVIWRTLLANCEREASKDAPRGHVLARLLKQMASCILPRKQKPSERFFHLSRRGSKRLAEILRIRSSQLVLHRNPDVRSGLARLLSRLEKAGLGGSEDRSFLKILKRDPRARVRKETRGE